MNGIGPFTAMEAAHAMKKTNPVWARLWDLLFIIVACAGAYLVCRLVGVVLT